MKGHGVEEWNCFLCSAAATTMLDNSGASEVKSSLASCSALELYGLDDSALTWSAWLV